MPSNAAVRPSHLRCWQECLRVLQGMTLHERQRHFDMRHWGVQTACGTVACIAGHCALDPWFRANSPIRFRWEPIPWTGEKRLRIPKASLDGTFGASQWERVFFGIGDHAQAVREVHLKIASITGQPVSPLGWGMP